MLVTDLLPGTRWRLARLLGRGGQAEVFLAEHVDLGTFSAIKVIRAGLDLQRRDDLYRRLRGEARILAKLRHPAIVGVDDFGITEDGRPFIRMPYIEGASLAEVLRARGSPFEIPRACALMREVAEGLQVAHEAGIIHRDIKPANILVATDGHAKLLDFGIAKALQEAGVSTTQTGYGIAVGTPEYMAPEQAKAEAVSPATDQYAFGVVLFELLTGSKLFPGDSLDIMRAHVLTPPSRLAARLGRAFPQQLEGLVARLLEKNPAHRFVDFREIEAALRFGDVAVSAGPALHTPLATGDGGEGPTAIDPVFARRTIRYDERPDRLPPSDEHPTRAGAPDAHALTAAVATTERVEAVREHVPTQATERIAALVDDDPATRTPLTAQDARTGTTHSIGTAPVGTGTTAATVAWSPSRVTVVLLTIAALSALGVGALAIVFPRRPAAIAEDVSGGQAAAPSASLAHESSAPSGPAVSPPSATPLATTPPSPGTGHDAPAVAGSPAACVSVAPSASAPMSTQKAPVKTPTPYEAARAAFQDGDLGTAEILARKAGGSRSAKLLLAEVLEREGKTSEARAIYRALVQDEPSLKAAVDGLKRTGG